MITNYIVIKIFMDTALHYFGRLTQERKIYVQFYLNQVFF